MCGTMLVELNVQRTMKRAELWAVFMTFSRCSDPVDNLGVVQALRRGTKPELGQNTRMGDWWRSRWETYLHMIQEELWSLQARCVRAHTPEKQRQNLTQYHTCETFGNDRADELARAGVGFDEAVFVAVLAEESGRNKETDLRGHQARTDVARTLEVW